MKPNSGDDNCESIGGEGGDEVGRDEALCESEERDGEGQRDRGDKA